MVEALASGVLSKLTKSTLDSIHQFFYRADPGFYLGRGAPLMTPLTGEVNKF